MTLSLPAEAGLIRGESLARHTSLKVGGPADYFQAVQSREQAVAALRAAVAAGLPVVVLGGGSNLLPADEGVDGLAIKYVGARHELVVDGNQALLVAEAGCSLAGLARRVSKQGWGGLEWAVNIPGTVGGAAVNNAGAFGSSTAEHLVALELADGSGQTAHVSVADLAYAYRSSRLKHHELGPAIVLQVEFALRRADPAELRAVVAHNQELRTRSQPRQLSAGSVFANPEGDYAGRLIEQAGLKGTRRGGAQISPQHANFIVNLGGATAHDVVELMRLAQQTVWASYHIRLRPEIELTGRWPAGILDFGF
ncbi:MAG: UDP-N-acetylmuramate dehydrogenase [Chloroflexi bacterium]|nr:UDP-N-acetylmuramate dehydrogenase [Chloroflexota bacterium]